MSSSCALNGLAQLNVAVSELDKPCRKSGRTWYVTIWNCDGSILEWCGRQYVVMPAKCGHLSVKLPEGCYYVSAVWSFSETASGYQANHFTDRALVTVKCNECTCVTLFNPHVHRCGSILVRAAGDLAADPGNAFNGAQFTALQAAIQPLLDAAPQLGAAFELDPQIDALAMLRQQVVQAGLEDAVLPVEEEATLATDLVANGHGQGQGQQ